MSASIPPEPTVTIRPVLVSRANAAAAIGIGLTTFDQIADDGRLGPLPVKLGRRVLYRVDELQNWAEAGCPRREVWIEK